MDGQHCGMIKYVKDKSGPYSIDCNGKIGSSIIVSSQTNSDNILVLCEVEVFGYESGL